MSDNLRLADQLVEKAATTIASAVETSYVHTPDIDVDAGIYNVDCSAFLGFLIGAIAERHYEMIAASTTDKRPLARDFYRFFAGLSPAIEQGWRRIDRLDEAVPGDVMAWELPEAKKGDTGHCFVIAELATAASDDDSRSVKVYDSTSITHYDDTRGDGPGMFATGIGSGSIHLRTDEAGAPTSFRFDPRAEHFKTVPMAIARLEPFSAR